MTLYLIERIKTKMKVLSQLERGLKFVGREALKHVGRNLPLEGKRWLYRIYLESDAWQKKRKAVLKSAGYRCRCGNRATEVHHETYERVFNERLSDLTAMCRPCHQAEHSKSDGGRKYGKRT